MTGSPSGNTKALVTVVIGDDFTAMWEQVMSMTWRLYAEKHGYDIIVIDDFIDDSDRAKNRHINWQKCLILEDERVCGYEDVVWLDADIMINYHTAPCIVETNSSDKIGLVGNKESFYDSPVIMDNLMLRHLSLTKTTRTCRSMQELYVRAGLDDSVENAANTGVIVLKPKMHTEVMRYVYDSFEENDFSMKEELPLSNHLYKNKLVNNLDKRFNWPWVYHIVESYPFLLLSEVNCDISITGQCVNAAWSNSWFLHFTGDTLNGEQSLRDHSNLVIKSFVDLEAYTVFRQILESKQSQGSG